MKIPRPKTKQDRFLVNLFIVKMIFFAFGFAFFLLGSIPAAVTFLVISVLLSVPLWGAMLLFDENLKFIRRKA